MRGDRIINSTNTAHMDVIIMGGGVGRAIKQSAANAIPIKAACLDLALKQLPDLASTFALGLDELLYLCVHSAVAKLSSLTKGPSAATCA